MIKYPDSPYGRYDWWQYLPFDTHFYNYYQLLIDISLFTLIGFGFLTVFLRFHRWSSLGFTFFAVAFASHYYIVIQALFSQIFNN